MTPVDAKKIIDRVEILPLYLHAYAFHLNMRLEKILPHDLLDIAHRKALTGVKIHVEDGESKSLSKMDVAALKAFGNMAKQYQLNIKIETSSSDAKTIDEAVHIALKTGASSVRFYPRYEGYLKDVLAKIMEDIAYIKKQYEHTNLKFVIEQHEDLKSTELVELVESSNFPNLSLLFDFGNMFNANELPLDALEKMKSHITQVHIKDVFMLKEGNGYGHRACLSGEGDVPFKEILQALICLGDDQPQIESFGLEEEVDYYAPAFRFDNEGDNPWIPYRTASETPMPKENLDARLTQEINDAMNQLSYVQKILKSLKEKALNTIKNTEP